MFELTILFAAILMFFAAFIAANTGLGGGVLYVPIMATFLQAPKNEIIAYSLLLAILTGTMAAYNHFRKNLVDARWSFLVGLPAVFSAIGSAFLSVGIAGKYVYFAFGILLFLISAKILYDITHEKKQRRKSRKKPFIAVFIAGCAGILTGLFGVGGGFLITVALIYFSQLNPRKAMGTTALAICFCASAGFGGYLYNSVISGAFSVGLLPAIVFGAFVLTGAFIGSRVGLKYLKTKTVYLMFVALLLIAAFKMITAIF